MDEDLRRHADGGSSAADPGEAAYRGFLFADLRGYTAFVERHGDTAAADLLDAYRELVRAEVSRHAGAEIRTEGDSFYVVFGSARRAVACGLAIVAAAEEASGEHPKRAIRVGIGINAGETVQRGEGFVGTAVNLAARVCAEAREGEVLVTAAVRDAIGAAPELRLVPRGTRRFKGIARPVALFAVRLASASGALPISAQRRRWLPIGAGLLGATVIAGGLWAVMPGMWQPELRDAQDPRAGQRASALAASSAGPSPIADPSAYPNAAESKLLAAVGEDIEPHCERADEDDRPVAVFVEGPLSRDITVEERTAALIGIACEIPGTSAPDTFYLWEVRQIVDYRRVDVPEALILNRAGRMGLVAPGDCAEGAPAYERWQLGDVGGWLSCRAVSGTAVIEWSYDGRPVFGRATRGDEDLAALLRWWTEEARLWAP